MKRLIFTLSVITGILLPLTAWGISFPEINTFKKDGPVSTYNEANLFEYINGAADGYIQAGFKTLYVQIYSKTIDESFTIDVYEMKNQASAFSIFKTENTSDKTLSIGEAGIYETGMLNFYKGQYYVKISAFGLGDSDNAILTKAAEAVAADLEETKKKSLFDCFPEAGRVPGSEVYTGNDFLGHSFLHSAFSVTLNTKQGDISPFIIKGSSADEIKNIIDNYLSLVKRKGLETDHKGNRLIFTDPYYKRKGKMVLTQSGNHLIGMFCKDIPTAFQIIEQIQIKLKEF